VRTRFLATLDENGTVDGLPSMPEMRKYCGKSFQVSSRVHKTCMEGTGMESLQRCRVSRSVLSVTVRRDDGCGRRCSSLLEGAPAGGNRLGIIGLEQRLLHMSAGNRLRTWRHGKIQRFANPRSCQQSAKLISAWEPRQYLEDVQCGTNGRSALTLSGVLRPSIQQSSCAHGKSGVGFRRRPRHR
jgi:hypothetical protein